MTAIFLALSITVNLVVIGCLLMMARRNKASAKLQPAVAKNQQPAAQRTIFCPACAQQIRFNLPLNGHKAKCRKCETRFRLDVDTHSNVYITEIKKPEPSPEINCLDDCYAVLEIKADAIPLDIRAAYKKKISEYHPDKVDNLGTKIKQIAEEETRLINLAYAMLEEQQRV